MRITQREINNIPLAGCFKTYTDQLQIFFIPICYALYHSFNKRTIQSVQGLVTNLVGGAGKFYLSIFYFNLDITINGLFQLSFRTFHCYDVIVAKRYSYSIWKCDRFSTYTRHKISLSFSIIKKQKVKIQNLIILLSFLLLNFDFLI